MTISNEIKLNFSDVLISPKPTEISSRSEVNLEVSYITKHSNRKISGVPVIAANMDSCGTISMARELAKNKMFTALHKFIPVNNVVSFLSDRYHAHKYSNYVFLTSGNNINKLNNTIQAILRYREKYQPNICLDVANGYMYSFLDTIKRVRNIYSDAIIMAGNVCTPEGVENIIKAGADIVKVGLAQGGLCDTKNKAGIGSPQFSVAKECGQVANDLNALCCTDGGVKTPADICKGLAAGSHFSMCGSIFLGYNQCTDSNWKVDENNNKISMKAYGMSSKSANDKYMGGLKTYRTSEGKEKWIDYKGCVSELAQDIKGSLASCCSYCNTSRLENLHKNAQFVRVK